MKSRTHAVGTIRTGAAKACAKNTYAAVIGTIAAATVSAGHDWDTGSCREWESSSRNCRCHATYHRRSASNHSLSLKRHEVSQCYTSTMRMSTHRTTTNYCSDNTRADCRCCAAYDRRDAIVNSLQSKVPKSAIITN
jgi:hypothetical protein